MSKRAAFGAVLMTGAAGETGQPVGLASRRQRPKTKFWNRRAKERNCWSARRGRKMLRSRIVTDDRPRAPNELGRCKQRQSSGCVDTASRLELRDDRVAGRDVSLASNHNDLELVGQHRGELRVKRPSLGAPRAARRQHDEVARYAI